MEDGTPLGLQLLPEAQDVLPPSQVFVAAFAEIAHRQVEKPIARNKPMLGEDVFFVMEYSISVILVAVIGKLQVEAPFPSTAQTVQTLHVSISLLKFIPGRSQTGRNLLVDERLQQLHRHD